MNGLPEYVVRRAAIRPALDGEWEGAAWREVLPLTVGHFHPASSGHRPEVQAKLVYDAECLYGLFRVKDRYVVCTHTGYQTPVYRDACVEFFVKPKADRGYMNFEMNCGGGLLLYYIADWRRKEHPADPGDEFESFTRVPREIGSRVKIYHSLPGKIFPEIDTAIEWRLEFHIPRGVLETFVGPLGDVPGQTWRGNFNKCADDSSHPHWAAWSSIGEELNLHQPDRFGRLQFE